MPARKTKQEGAASQRFQGARDIHALAGGAGCHGQRAVDGARPECIEFDDFLPCRSHGDTKDGRSHGV